MPRYFIDSDDGDLLVTDEEGYELPDVREARKLAISVLPDMARERLPDGDRRTFEARVRDAEGTIVYTATLSLVGEWSDPPPSEPRS